MPAILPSAFSLRTCRTVFVVGTKFCVFVVFSIQKSSPATPEHPAIADHSSLTPSLYPLKAYPPPLDVDGKVVVGSVTFTLDSVEGSLIVVGVLEFVERLYVTPSTMILTEDGMEGVVFVSKR